MCEKYFKNACAIHLRFIIARYLMANTFGRLDGAEQAQRHIEMCEFYTAIAFNTSGTDGVRNRFDGAEEFFSKLHDTSQDKLTDHLDTVIGFPLDKQPDYNKMELLFFDIFHGIAVDKIVHQTS